jgi:hypothetical protein
MISILDRFCDLILEIAEKRNRVLVKISDQAAPIAENLIKIAVFRNDQWKDELIDKIDICQTRKLIGKRTYPTKKEYFKLLYDEYYPPEEPWNKSILYKLMIKWLNYYKNSRDLYSPFWKNKVTKEDVNNLQMNIKYFITQISEILSKGDFISPNDDGLYSKEGIKIIEDYIKKIQRGKHKKLNEILDELDEYNDIYEDLYNRELHDLSDEDSEKLTVKEFLLLLLDENSDDS